MGAQLPYLGRDEILAAEDLAIEDHKVPEWGGVVRLREMSGADRQQYELYCLDIGEVNIRAALLSLSIVDEAGQRIFTELDHPELAKKSSRALDRLTAHAMRLNLLRPKDITALEKNSDRGPRGTSTSSSRVISA